MQECVGDKRTSILSNWNENSFRRVRYL